MGFEPTDGGFADLSLRPLGYRAGCNEYNEPDATSITKRRANCQLSAGRANLKNFRCADLFCGGRLRDKHLRLIVTVKEPPGLLE